jgi:predicted dehydrogenase
MAERRLGIIVSGGTGRMGRGHHLPALTAIRAEGGLPLAGGDRLVPELFLVGRDNERLGELGRTFGIERYTTDLDQALSEPAYDVFFDSSVSRVRPALLLKAIRAGKHIYSEKPVATSAEQGVQILKEAESRGLKHGVVEDKLHMPGIKALRQLRDSGFFGRIIRFHLDFGFWVFDGEQIPCQRPSWNYRSDQDGGIMLDMFSHWRYLIEDLLGRITSLTSSAWTAIPERVDEHGARYRVDVEDSGMCMVTLDNGARGSISTSWATRAKRNDRLSLHIDGTDGSAEVGYQSCFIQPATEKVKAAAEDSKGPDAGGSAAWRELPLAKEKMSSCRIGWEAFLRHVADGAPLQSDLKAGIRDVQFGVLTLQGAKENRWLSFPP